MVIVLKKKLFLHIGFHKTGTSALQEYLNENRNKLIENGVLYLERYDKSFPGNVDLSWAYNKNPPHWSTFNNNREDVIGFYKEQLSAPGFDKAIISSEDFTLLDTQPETVRAIRNDFSDFEVKVVAYVREPIDFIVSLYSHAVRAKVVDCSFKDYISKHFNFRSADFSLRLQPWVKEFGKTNVVVRNYSRSALKNNNLLDDFFEVIDVELLNNSNMSQSNVGVHPWLIDTYIEVSKSSLLEDEKAKKLLEILNLGKGLPKVDAARYLLEKGDFDMIQKVYSVALNRLRRDFNVEF